MTFEVSEPNSLIIGKAVMSDCRGVYELRYSEDVRVFFEDKTIPQYAGHCDFFKNHLSEYTVARLVVNNRESLVGFCRMKFSSLLDGFRLLEPSIAVALHMRGHGIAHMLLMNAENCLKKNGVPCIIFGKTHYGNTATMRLFETSHYRNITVPQSDCHYFYYIKTVGAD
jgi:hypothetical protein